MPSEEQAFSLAVDAFTALDSIREDVAQIKGVNSDVLALLESRFSEVPAVESPEVAPLAPLAGSVAVEEVPAFDFGAFADDLMAFQWMQTVTGLFLLVAVLLNLGATLWLAFSDKWRS